MGYDEDEHGEDPDSCPACGAELDSYVCDECGREFDSQRALSSHQAQASGH